MSTIFLWYAQDVATSSDGKHPIAPALFLDDPNKAVVAGKLRAAGKTVDYIEQP